MPPALREISFVTKPMEKVIANIESVYPSNLLVIWYFKTDFVPSSVLPMDKSMAPKASVELNPSPIVFLLALSVYKAHAVLSSMI